MDADLKRIMDDIYGEGPAPEPPSIPPPVYGMPSVDATPKPSPQSFIERPSEDVILPVPEDDLDRMGGTVKPKGLLSSVRDKILVNNHLFESRALLPEQPPITQRPKEEDTSLRTLSKKSDLLERMGLRPEGTSPQEKARAANIVAIAQDTKLPMNFVESNYDAITKRMGIRGVPTSGEMVDAFMKAGIAAGLVTAPVATAVGLVSYMGAKEAENLSTAQMQGQRGKLGAGREFKEMLGPLKEPLQSAVDVAEVVIPGAMSGGVLKGLPDVTKAAWYRKMTIPERDLVNVAMKNMSDEIRAGKTTVSEVRKLWENKENREALIKKYAMGETVPGEEPAPKAPAGEPIRQPAPEREGLPAGQGFELKKGGSNQSPFSPELAEQAKTARTKALPGTISMPYTPDPDLKRIMDKVYRGLEEPPKQDLIEHKGGSDGYDQPKGDVRPSTEYDAGEADAGGRAEAQKETPEEAPAVGATADESIGTSTAVVQGDFPVQRVPVSEIGAKPDELQFKLDVNDTGVQEPLKGEWNELAAGNALIWEAKDGKKYIANGHHRLDLAKRQGVKEINAQVLKEADGYTINDARKIAAEANILEGKGTIYDQAEYFRLSSYAPDVARQRGISGRGYTIGRLATPETYSQFRSRDISPEAAEAVAGAAPNNPTLQNAGVKYALNHPKADSYEINNFVKALSTIGAKPAATGDLFGFDDSAIQAAEKMGKAAAAEVRSLRDKVAAVQGAAKRPETARSLGVDVKDPESIKAKIADLKGKIEGWGRWETDPGLVAELKKRTGLAVSVEEARAPYNEGPIQQEISQYNEMVENPEYRLPPDIEIVRTGEREREIQRQWGIPNVTGLGKDAGSVYINDDTGKPVAFVPSRKALVEEGTPFQERTRTPEGVEAEKKFRERYVQTPEEWQKTVEAAKAAREKRGVSEKKKPYRTADMFSTKDMGHDVQTDMFESEAVQGAVDRIKASAPEPEPVPQPPAKGTTGEYGTVSLVDEEGNLVVGETIKVYGIGKDNEPKSGSQVTLRERKTSGLPLEVKRGDLRATERRGIYTYEPGTAPKPRLSAETAGPEPRSALLPRGGRHEKILASIQDTAETGGNFNLKPGETVADALTRFRKAWAEKEKKFILDDESGRVALDILLPGYEAGRDAAQAIASLVLPTAKSPEHLQAAEILSGHLGKMHRGAEATSFSLHKDRFTFDKLGVHNPETPLEKNVGIKFMSNMSQGRSMAPNVEAIADRVTATLEAGKKRLEEAGAPLGTVREHYFPGMFTKESIKAFNLALQETGEQGVGNRSLPLDEWPADQKKWVKERTEALLKEGKGAEGDALSYLAKRPFKGSESFRKKKTFDDIMTAVEFGLKPISNNPIDLIQLKLAEMDRSAMANGAINEWKERGDVVFLRSGKDMPNGFANINDKFGTVYGPPEMLTKEYVDHNVYNALDAVVKNLGIRHERKASAGRGKLGYAERSGEDIVTQAGTELGVMAHEIGHALDFKYGLWDRIVLKAESLRDKTVDFEGKPHTETKAASRARTEIQKELRSLADLTWEGHDASASFKKKVRKKEEKIAHIVEAFVQAPDRLASVAPNVRKSFMEFVKEIPELKPLEDIKTGISYKELQTKKNVGGFPVVGHWIAREPVADVLNNYLSSSLYNNKYFGKPFKAWQGAANHLNQFQLGVFSAFHAGFTEADVFISSGANVIKDVYGIARGNRTASQLGETVKKASVSMIRTPLEGGKVLKDWRSPEVNVSVDVPVSQLPQDTHARVGMITKAAELAGGGFKLEQGLRTDWTDKMVREWYSDQKIKAALRSPIAMVELSAKPIMEWLVPRQKAGVFSELAGRIIEQNPGKTLKELQPQFRQAWNRVDARLGQVRYDRLFMNNVAKNVLQAGVRAPGWTGGTIAEVGGSAKDAAKFFAEWVETGKAPKELPDRVAYTIALFTTIMGINGLLTYAFTGEKPEGMDWWAFRDGGKDERGKPTRWLLPTYLKDIYAYTEDLPGTLMAKTHPIFSLAGDLAKNRDYYRTKIRNEDDPWPRQVMDSALYAAKQYVPFWMRGAVKEGERGGGILKTLKESPQKLIAPEFGIMPATKAYTATPFEKFASKTIESRMPAGARTKEQAEKSKLKSDLRMAIRREDPEANANLMKAVRERKITEREKDNILKEAKENPTAHAAKNMVLDDLARGIEKASPEERKIIKPIFRKKLFNKIEAGTIDAGTKKRYLELLRRMSDGQGE